MRRDKLAGQRFGHWTAIARDVSTKSGAARWACRCDCGGAAIVRADSLKSGSSQSCGKCDHGEELPRGVLMAMDLRRIAWKQKLAAAVDERLQGLARIDRRRELERIAAEVAQVRRQAAAR
jgi:hypothetical protein